MDWTDPTLSFSPIPGSKHKTNPEKIPTSLHLTTLTALNILGLLSGSEYDPVYKIKTNRKIKLPPTIKTNLGSKDIHNSYPKTTSQVSSPPKLKTNPLINKTTKIKTSAKSNAKSHSTWSSRKAEETPSKALIYLQFANQTSQPKNKDKDPASALCLTFSTNQCGAKVPIRIQSSNKIQFLMKR